MKANEDIVTQNQRILALSTCSAVYVDASQPDTAVHICRTGKLSLCALRSTDVHMVSVSARLCEA